MNEYVIKERFITFEVNNYTNLLYSYFDILLCKLMIPINF